MSDIADDTTSDTVGVASATITFAATKLNGDPLGNKLSGTSGDDIINGVAGDDTIYGGGGSDTLFGSNGNDVLYGEAGAKDALFGGAGNDTLVGGAGKDALFGEGGADVFVFTKLSDSLPGGGPHTSYGHDIIKPSDPNSGKGFDGAGSAGGDVIDLRGCGDLTWGKTLKVVDNYAHTYVEIDMNRDGKLDFELAIYDGTVKAAAYTVADFLFH